MPFKKLQPIAAIALAAIALTGSPAPVVGQAVLTGVEQARVDSARRPYTAADIEFISGMIGHHAQAVTMAGWAESHGAGKSLQILCGRIVTGQSAEIQLMQQWLRDRKQPVPDADPRGMKMTMGGVDSYMLMPGMLTESQMKRLDAARGVEWDRLFLTFMIGHHQGALMMVEKLFNTDYAANDEFVFKFATAVHVDQETEIDRMTQMLDALPRPVGGQ